jgi:hypothetical protein
VVRHARLPAGNKLSAPVITTPDMQVYTVPLYRGVPSGSVLVYHEVTFVSPLGTNDHKASQKSMCAA